MIKLNFPNGKEIAIDENNSTELNNDFLNSICDLKCLDKIYLSSDFHVLREFVGRNEDHSKYLIPYDEEKLDKNRLNNLEDMMRVVTDDVAFIHLGDLSESEFEIGSTYLEKVKEFYQKILHKETRTAPRILIRGNNDVLPKEIYKEFGFDAILTKLKLGNILLTHKPMNVDNNHINIHGHLHESKSYFDISPKNHINVYFETNDGPQTIETFLNWFKEGKYSDTYMDFSEEYRTSDMIEDTGVNYE